MLAGNTFGLTVDELNAQNQIDTSYNGCVTVSLASNPGNSTLGGTLTVHAVNGVATFSDLTINNPGLAYTLQVSATGTSAVTTAPFDVAGYELVASGGSENLAWYGTSGSDQVQFAQTAAGTVQITVSELGGIPTSFTGTVTGVTGDVVVNEYDVAGDADVVDGSGLTAISSLITVVNGNDTVTGGGGANTIVAGNGNNTIYGNGIGNSPNASGVEDPSNTITVGNGDNIIYGNYSGSGYQGGNDTITAGDGNNTIYGNYGEGGRQSFAFGEPFFDGAEGSNNTITVGNGDNTIYGNYGYADGGEGGSNTIIAGNGNDVIYGNANGNDPQRLCGSNFIQVGNGNDTIYGNLGGDGGEGGNNTILTGSGQDTIYGNFGGDGGEGGNNLIVAGGGNDTIYAHCGLPATSHTSGTTAEGQDLIIGGTGTDTVYGWPAGYTLGTNTGDLFIAGTTNLSLTALDAVLAEWDSSDSYATRMAYLSGPTAQGANGSNYLIPGTTVIASTAVDEIFGTVDSDDDWYLVTSNDVLIERRSERSHVDRLIQTDPKTTNAVANRSKPIRWKISNHRRHRKARKKDRSSRRLGLRTASASLRSSLSVESNHRVLGSAGQPARHYPGRRAAQSYESGPTPRRRRSGSSTTRSGSMISVAQGASMRHESTRGRHAGWLTRPREPDDSASDHELHGLVCNRERCGRNRVYGLRDVPDRWRDHGRGRRDDRRGRHVHRERRVHHLQGREEHQPVVSLGSRSEDTTPSIHAQSESRVRAARTVSKAIRREDSEPTLSFDPFLRCLPPRGFVC